MNDLKPCPWCGAKVNMTYNSLAQKFHVYHSGYVECPFDDITIDQFYAGSLAEAREVWNRRRI